MSRRNTTPAKEQATGSCCCDVHSWSPRASFVLKARSAGGWLPQWARAAVAQARGPAAAVEAQWCSRHKHRQPLQAARCSWCRCSACPAPSARMRPPVPQQGQAPMPSRPWSMGPASKRQHQRSRCQFSSDKTPWSWSHYCCTCCAARHPPFVPLWLCPAVAPAPACASTHRRRSARSAPWGRWSPHSKSPANMGG